MKYFLSTALLFAALAAPARATQTTWIPSMNASDGSWFDSANWTNGVPDSATDATIYAGTVQITGGGTAHAGILNPGLEGTPPGESFLEITNASLIVNEAYLTSIYGSATHLTVGSGGVFQIETATSLYVMNTPTFINLNGTPGNRGRLLAVGIFKQNYTGAQVTFDGGQFTAMHDGSLFMGFDAGSAQVGSIYIGSGGAFIDTDGHQSEITASLQRGFYGVDGLDPDGGLTKLGDGSLTLSGANQFIGDTTVESGTLFVNGSTYSAVHVSGAGVLGGTGRIATSIYTFVGPLISTIDGTLAPGIDGAGLLTFSGGLTLGTGSTTSIELGGTDISLFDRVSIASALAYGGTLNLTLTGGFAPQVGDSFQIFKDFATQSGAFTNISFSAPGHTGSFDYATGTLHITAVPEPSASARLIAVLLLAIVAARKRRSPRV